MSKERMISDAMFDIRRNYQQGAHTLGLCRTCKKRHGRGSICADCAEETLATLVGEDLAKEYHQSCAHYLSLLMKIDNVIAKGCEQVKQLTGGEEQNVSK